MKHMNKKVRYKLVWKAQGTTFFDDFEFQTEDFNYGIVNYLDHKSAVAAGVAVAHETHAILRTGAREGGKRQSVKVQSKNGYKHFFMMVRYTHVPYGCGLWPALWLLGLDKEWPLAGELDIIEYVSDIPQEFSFHVGAANKCTLDPALVQKYGRMPDVNKMSYNCVTDYSKGLNGCAPNKVPQVSGEQLSKSGGVMAIEISTEQIKVFHIPEAELPSDIDTAQPKPDAWDKWVISYLPLAASEAKNPGSCPHPWDIISPQHLIININLCGQWGGPMWPYSPTCVNHVGPKFPGQCSIVDPIAHPEDLEKKDCCAKFILDESGEYGAEQYLRDQAYFNISYVKIYQLDSKEGEPTLVI